MKIRIYIILVALILFTHTISAQDGVRNTKRVSVSFWNVENLFDTIPSPFYDDSDFTPHGKNRWDAERYSRKLNNLSRVIEDMGSDIIALAEVENEQTVRDLVMTLKDDYCYIHHTSSDSRGIDLALLYKGDKFFPEKSKLIYSSASREFLHVQGSVMGEKINILICHLPSKVNKYSYRKRAMERLKIVADSISKTSPYTKTIVMGDFNCDPSERPFRNIFGKVRQQGLHTMFYDRSGYLGAIKNPQNGGIGSYIYDGRHFLLDNILLSPLFVYDDRGLKFDSGGVFIRQYMMQIPEDKDNNSRKGLNHPLRTFSAGRYIGGYSDHLPVYVVLN